MRQHPGVRRVQSLQWAEVEGPLAVLPPEAQAKLARVNAAT